MPNFIVGVITNLQSLILCGRMKRPIVSIAGRFEIALFHYFD